MRTALPDARPGWESLPQSIDEMGRTEDHDRWLTVTVDIPTSVEGMDCWPSFCVIEPGGEVREAFVSDVHAVRSSCGEHKCDMYSWDDHEKAWVLATEGDESDT